MMAIHINDSETDTLVRRLADAWSTGVTETVKRAVVRQLESEGLPTNVERAEAETLEDALRERLRRETVEYVRLRQEVFGKKSGSRVYKMLAAHGPVETLRRLMDRPTDGLMFLAEHDRLDLASEHAALDDKFKNIIPEDIRALAGRNLAAAEAFKKHKK